MTHITDHKTKSAFKKAVKENPANVGVSDPSIFNPVSGSVKYVLDDHGPFTVTNHPKRSWFARVSYDNKGNVKVE